MNLVQWNRSSIYLLLFVNVCCVAPFFHFHKPVLDADSDISEFSAVKLFSFKTALKIKQKLS